MIYFLHGKDNFSINNEIKKKISEIKSADIDIVKIEGEEIRSSNDLSNLIQSQGLFTSRKLIIVRNVQLKIKTNDLKAEIAESIKQLPKGVSLIFAEEGDPDKRGKLFKTLSKIAKVSEFRELNGAEVEGWIATQVENRGFAVSNSAKRDLAFSIGANLQLLNHEIDKLILYAKSQNSVQIEQNHIYKLTHTIEDPQIFPFIEAVAQKNVGLALKLLHQFSNIGENEHYLLTMIIYQFRILLMVKDLQLIGKSQIQIASEAKLHPFVVKKSIQVINSYSINQIISILFTLLKVDEALKTGEMEANFAIDYLVAKIAT